jgi:hypothetical protein
MEKRLAILLAAGLFLYPFAASAIDYGSQTSQTQQAPPVAQTLVREGDFAVKLAAKLDLGSTTDEASAEDLLARAGVVPLNGWISDYPMTPAIMGQLRESITGAAAEGRLSMDPQEAVERLYALAGELNLPTPAGPGHSPEESQSALAGKSNSTVINNYYYDQGPPVVTYYPPPAEYVYLYHWVPYPAWWYGYWFPGFFICRDFTTTVVVSAVVVNRPFIGTRIAIVSNRIIDPVSRVTVVVAPVVRTGSGRVRPITTLRAGNGRTFGSISEVRREAGSIRPRTVMPGAAPNNAAGNSGFRSAEDRRRAESILSRGARNMRDAGARENRAIRGEERRSVAPGVSGRSFNKASRGENRRFIAPRLPNGSSIESSRSGERRIVTPGPPKRERTFTGTGRSAQSPFVAPRQLERSIRSSGGRDGDGSVRLFVPRGSQGPSINAPGRGGGNNSSLSPSSGKGKRGRGGSGSGFGGGDCGRGRC